MKLLKNGRKRFVNYTNMFHLLMIMCDFMLKFSLRSDFPSFKCCEL